MNLYADRKRKERSFEVGEWVYLRLYPYRHSSMALRQNLNLSPQFFGPFQIIQRVGEVAYKLKLPKTSKFHPVFMFPTSSRHLAVMTNRVLPCQKLMGAVVL